MPFLPRPQKLKGMVGDKGFDPLGLVRLGARRVAPRERSSSTAASACSRSSGFVATDLGFRLPGEMHQVASINAHDMAVDMGAMTQIGIWIAVAECIGYLAILEMLDERAPAGGLRLRPAPDRRRERPRDAAQGARERPAGHARVLGHRDAGRAHGQGPRARWREGGLGYVTDRAVLAVRARVVGGAAAASSDAVIACLRLARRSPVRARGGDCHGRGTFETRAIPDETTGRVDYLPIPSRRACGLVFF